MSERETIEVGERGGEKMPRQAAIEVPDLSRARVRVHLALLTVRVDETHLAVAVAVVELEVARRLFVEARMKVNLVAFFPQVRDTK